MHRCTVELYVHVAVCFQLMRICFECRSAYCALTSAFISCFDWTSCCFKAKQVIWVIVTVSLIHFFVMLKSRWPTAGGYVVPGIRSSDVRACLQISCVFTFFIHLSTHPLGNVFTSDSEAECLLRILKIVMRSNSSESLCALAYFIILSVGRGSAGFYSCNPQKKHYNPRPRPWISINNTTMMHQKKKD